MWMAVFKTGKQTDSSGNEKDWTEQDLDTMVSNYLPEENEAPIVIGHPDNNAPAWGWIETLKRDGDTLYAKVKDLVPEFAEMLKKKMFKKRSISLYPDLKLRHIGFLGAAPPAVKGLPDFAFTDETKITSFEFTEESFDFSDEKFWTVGRIVRRLREWFIEKYDIETADKIVMSWDVETLMEEKNTRNYNDKKKELDVTKEEFDEKIKAKELEIANFSKKANDALAENAKLKEQAEKDRTEKQTAEYSQFADKLVSDGKLLPAQKSQVVDLMQVLSASTEYEFSEGGKKSPVDVFQAVLEVNSKQIEFDETATKDKGQGGAPNHAKIEKLIAEEMEKNEKMDYSEAFISIQKKNPDLAKAYQAEIGV